MNMFVCHFTGAYYWLIRCNIGVRYIEVKAGDDI